VPGLILRIGEADERLLRAVVARRSRTLDRVMRAVTLLGEPVATVLWVSSLLLGIVPVPPPLAVEVAVTVLVSHLAVQGVKRWTVRPRPRLPVGMGSMIEAPDRFSFPSGHAAASLGVALPLALTLPWPAALPLLGLALLVGTSRCYLGVHYPGDVVVGWLLTLASFGGVRLLLAA